MDTVTFHQELDGNTQVITGLSNGDFSVTHTSDTAGLASKAAVASTHHIITGIDVSTDLDGAVVTLKENTTTKWQLKIGDASAVSPIARTFPTPITLAANKTANLAINGTANCEANLFGYSVLVQ